ncbi:hypothetical protein DFA_05334 [Cavenderia fasciculata]|uniref:Uncharacterized protein n=1 Tax=Cavenderia fasciculata TaxID=261658 RepID=F4PKY0_CACFS|nr:uncharacterized protein DFA_05334 [Cavenderia fasciculata]EGG23202.1 hypothetical protein DFA_05334 [Cavenderia fasciculata]|eukprot:XP_004361053.1 hypothetical protein DFA_05334 [Cavenderia fasciculata]
MTTYKEATINPKFQWVAFDLRNLRQCNGTYDEYDDVPPLPNPKVVDLEDVHSPTACYLLNESYQTRDEGENPDGTLFDLGPATAVVGDQTIQLNPFYNDQQTCVTWYTGSDGKVYHAFRAWEFTYCAASLAEFTTRIKLEAELWFALNKYSREELENGREDFSAQEWAYIEYYLSKDPTDNPNIKYHNAI